MDLITNNIDSMFDMTLRMAIFNQFKGDNGIMNTILTIIILTTTTYLVKYFKTFFNKNIIKNNNFYIFYNFYNLHYILCKKNEIEYKGKTTTMTNIYDNNLTVTTSFSDNFKAIWSHINECIETNPTIYQIKEVYSFHGPKNVRECDSFYIVSQNNSFLMDEDLGIYGYTNICQEDSEDGEAKKKNKVENIIITLYSYKSSLSDMKNFVHNITKKYIATLQNIRHNKKFLYEVTKTKYEDNSYECWKESIFESNRTFNNFFFDNKKEVLKKIDFFLNNKQWYNEKGIPYTLGIGLHGPPGTGKTSFIKALANKTGRHIISFSFKIIKTKNQLNSIFFEEQYNPDNKKGSMGFDKKIIAFEDIDCIGDIILKRDESKTSSRKSKKVLESQSQVTNFIEQLVNLESTDQKETIKFSSPLLQEEPITLDDILNLWDGIRESPGRIIVMSSNHYNKLDPALTRPGRIDISLELTNASHNTINEIYFNLFKQNINPKQLQKITPNFYSPAEIINIFLDENTDAVKMVKRMMENRHRD